VIYLDTSATVKLVTAEQESPALINWLNDHPGEHLATSAIGHIELIRAATRAGDSLGGAPRLSLRASVSFVQWRHPDAAECLELLWFDDINSDRVRFAVIVRWQQR
jgi:predicted nucleic acid-binding protein